MKETPLPRSGNQQARSAESTSQLLNFFCLRQKNQFRAESVLRMFAEISSIVPRLSM